MKRRLVRLKRLAENAETQEERALRAMATLSKDIAVQETAVERLRGFYEEYASRRHELLGGQHTLRQLANMNAFVDRLQREMSAAEETISRLREELENKRQIWLQRRSGRHRLEHVLQSGESELRQHEERLEQASVDDWTSYRGSKRQL